MIGTESTESKPNFSSNNIKKPAEPQLCLPAPQPVLLLTAAPPSANAPKLLESATLLSSELVDVVETAAPLKRDRKIPGFLLLPLIGLLLLTLNVPQVFPMACTFFQTHGTELLIQIGLLEEPEPETELQQGPVELAEEISSTQAILIDLETGEILAEKDAETAVYPASMTKIMTLLIAAEQISNLDDTFTMSQELLDTAMYNDLAAAGFQDEETIPLRDLLYGIILPSGADAVYGITTYLAGSESVFTAEMNTKAARLGLGSVHFENATGCFQDAHLCSVHDMAVILWFAMQNDICREVLTSTTHTTASTTQHPDGLTLVNQFLVLAAKQDCGAVQMIAAKTGFVDEAGHCAASYAVAEDGHAYICVTANTASYEQVAADHAALYANYAVPALSPSETAA